jgi:hypothetical protein
MMFSAKRDSQRFVFLPIQLGKFIYSWNHDYNIVTLELLEDLKTWRGGKEPGRYEEEEVLCRNYECMQGTSGAVRNYTQTKKAAEWWSSGMVWYNLSLEFTKHDVGATT